MFSPIDNPFCVLPVCYRPLTVMLVDDDPDFLKQLSLQLSEHLPVITFSEPEKAISYFEQQNAQLFKKWTSNQSSSSLINNAREEIYNPNRFKDIIVSVVDYEMPNKTGFDIISTMGEELLGAMSFHSYVLLTGKRFSELDQELASSSIGKNFISKWDPNRVPQLLSAIEHNNSHAFQMMSYPAARELRNDEREKTTILFDNTFLPILNNYIKEHQVCELYLYDKQGSYLFLDEKANLSWFFVRNDLGMENTIQLAKQFQAPSSIIDAIESREQLLCDYEKEDFECLKPFDWEQYLVPATVFIGEDHSKYYYAFTNNFIGHNIDLKKVVSFRSYLDSIE